MSPVKYNELRFSVDDRNESLGKKIREASSMKIPLQIIIGPKDMVSRQVSVRTKSSEQKIHIDKLIDFIEGLN
jgi:threonine--tRNA ligase